MLQTSTANLERVRKMKTRHQRLQTRVTTVREELQSFLEDDDDMMKMCLTHKKEQEHNQAELQRAGGEPLLPMLTCVESASRQRALASPPLRH